MIDLVIGREGTGHKGIGLIRLVSLYTTEIFLMYEPVMGHHGKNGEGIRVTQGNNPFVPYCVTNSVGN